MSIPHVVDGETDLDSLLFNPIIDGLNDNTTAHGVLASQVGGLQGRGVTLLYDDFSAYANGSPSGEETVVGGFAWVTSGSEPPTVTSGKLSSTGSGYLYTTLDAAPIVVEAEVSFGGTGNDTACCTIAICKTGGGTLLHNIAHMIFGPSGANLQIEKDNTGVFDFILAGLFRGHVFRMGLRGAVRGAYPLDKFRPTHFAVFPIGLFTAASFSYVEGSVMLQYQFVWHSLGGIVCL